MQGHRNQQIFKIPSFRGRVGVLWCLALVLLVGCAGRFPAERIPKTKWLVMPLEQPPTQSTHPRAIQGWWLGARTLRQNPRAGAMLAESFIHDLAALECLNLYSPIQIRAYFAEKRRLIEEAYPHLSREEIELQLAQVPPIEFARELGADKILSGRIDRHYMGENWTIHWWWSTIQLQCEMTDVMTGQVEWSRKYRVRKQFASQSDVQREIAARLVKDLKKEYLRPMAEQ
jgi:hypothetical protein